MNLFWQYDNLLKCHIHNINVKHAEVVLKIKITHLKKIVTIIKKPLVSDEKHNFVKIAFPKPT
jgi:hypothetical protein